MKDHCIHVLLVDDDPLERQLLKANLSRGRRVQVQCVSSAEEALTRLGQRSWDAVMTDLVMPGMSGIDLVRCIRRQDPTLPVIIVTANGAVDRAVEGIRAGATEYLIKPIDSDKLFALLERALQARQRTEEIGLADVVIAGDHRLLDEVRAFARRVASIPHARVLITGPSGTGKSLLARTIHELSGATGQLVVVNCAALPGNLLESELFGHERGAFTDARTQKSGLIELATDGTLFLDEIGAMPLELQAKLLPFLENHEMRPVGGTRPITVRTRVIAAANDDLRQRAQQRTFRADLLYRLDVASIELPPLAQMPGVIAELAQRFVREACDQFKRPLPPMGPDTFAALPNHSWPGNVRELRNVVENGVIFHEGGELVLRPPAAAAEEPAGFAIPYGLTLEEVERRYIVATIESQPHLDYVQLSIRLGIARKTLWEKRRRYGL